MQITSFNISESKTSINLVITDAASITSLYLWKHTNYKNYLEAIDLSSKLTSSSTETITITLSDINEIYFDGVYFIEAEDIDEVSSAITQELSRYKECNLDKILTLSLCDDCLKNNSNSIINSHNLLTSLEYAIELGFPNEIVNITKTLDKYCSDECKSCGGYQNIKDNNDSDTSNTDDLEIIVDGGGV